MGKVLALDGTLQTVKRKRLKMSLVLDGSNGITTPGPVNGAATMLSPITNSLSGNVSLSNTSLYFDGPSVAQGTSGTWFVSGIICMKDGDVGNSQYFAKLWDGTTVIASGIASAIGQNNYASISLSGYISSPAGNLRISCRDIFSTSGLMLFNQSGNSKDSTITAIRIG